MSENQEEQLDDQDLKDHLPVKENDAPGPMEVDEDQESEGSAQEDYRDQPFEDEELEDNEETIAAEEALKPDIDPAEELQLLAQDAGMTLDELQAISMLKRSRRPKPVELEKPSSSSTLELITNEIRPASPKTDSMPHENEESKSEVKSTLKDFYLGTQVRGESDEEDQEYFPMKLLNREIRVGEDYQATVDFPSCSKAREHLDFKDELLWAPPITLSESQIKEYVKAADLIINEYDNKEHPIIKFGSDHPLALNCLMNCGYNSEAALEMLRKKLAEQEVSI